MKSETLEIIDTISNCVRTLFTAINAVGTLIVARIMYSRLWVEKKEQEQSTGKDEKKQ